MLPLTLPGQRSPDRGRLRVLALGAHPDDVELGAGGLLLRLAARPAPAEVTVCVLSGRGGPREPEARAAAEAFSPGAAVTVHDLPDGRMPGHWASVKDVLEDLASRTSPDLILAPHPGDAHQDHRLLAELVPTVWRDALVLGYEIPKWDGDLARPQVYVPLAQPVARRKWELLDASYPSQRGRDWWDAATVLGLARLRGVECRSGHAEAYLTTKLTLGL